MHSVTTGSKAQVWHGTALKTSGGLKKSDLMMNKHDRIVSKKKHASGKKLMKKMMKSPKMRKIFKANQQKIKSRSKKRSKRSKRRDGGCGSSDLEMM
jgi:site-specific DNA-adenine methylase